MHVVTTLLVTLYAWKRGYIDRWKKYHSTILYIISCDLLYNVVCSDYRMWSYIPHVIPGYAFTMFVYTFLVLPIIAILFLSNYPESGRKEIISYHLKWISVFLLLEGLYVQMGWMSYEHGWTLAWSVVFYFMMFPLLRLHHKKPVIAYLATIVAIYFWITIFDVPLESQLRQ